MSHQDYTETQKATDPDVEALQANASQADEPQAGKSQAGKPGQEANPQDEVSVDALKAQLATLAAAYESAKDQSLRSQAEAQNARRRAEQDVEKAHKYGLEKIVNDLLPVVDNLERAIASIDVENELIKPLIEGIQLTHKSFLDALARHQVVVVNPQGEPFDPNLHQAVSAVPNPDVEPNTVINCFQKGYTLHGRLVRPAMVVVSKAP